MSKLKKIILFLIVVVILIGGGFLVYYFLNNRDNAGLLAVEEEILRRSQDINNQNNNSGDKAAINLKLSELPNELKNLVFTEKYQKEDYAKAISAEEKIKTDSENYYNYNEAGFYWKSLGELTKKEIYFNRAIEVYSFAGKKFENKKIYQPYQNLANVYIILKNYEKAEEAIKNAIELAPEVGELYVKLAVLYKDLMNKPQSDIIAVYELALRQYAYQPEVIYPAYAYYLCGVGKDMDALEKTKIDCGSFFRTY